MWPYEIIHIMNSLLLCRDLATQPTINTHTHTHTHTRLVFRQMHGQSDFRPRQRVPGMYIWPQFLWIMSVHIHVYVWCTMLCVFMCVLQASACSVSQKSSKCFQIYLCSIFPIYSILVNQCVSWIYIRLCVRLCESSLLTFHMPNITVKYTWNIPPPLFLFP